MKKTINEILWNYYASCLDENVAKQQLIELFILRVPKKCNCVGPYYDQGWNDCRDQMIKNLEKLK